MRAEYLHRMVPLLLVLPEPNYHSTTKKVGSLKPGASCIANEDSSTGDNEVKLPEESCQQLLLELNDEEGKFLQPFALISWLRSLSQVPGSDLCVQPSTKKSQISI